MRFLLDECLPARLRLSLPGHEVQTVPHAGWAGIKNGKLLRLISDANQCDVFITMDKNLPSQHKISGLSFAVVVLRAASNRFEHVNPLMALILQRLSEFKSGQVFVMEKVND